MKCLVDAQLPRRLSDLLQTLGHEVIHTLDLPDGNRTSDQEINRISLEQERIVVTKDADFVDSYLLHGEPYKLLVVATGNVHNTELLELFRKNVNEISNLFSHADYVELTRDSLIVRN